MNARYQPAEIESKWSKHWESSEYQQHDTQEDSFCLMLPPPNVTGSLHMGHAFQQTLMDILTRYHRMSGKQSLWQGGCDHAGIATQMMVERELSKQGKSRTELGRDAFLQAVWDWKDRSGGTIFGQMRRLGDSVDWSNLRFTMDEGMSKATMHAFSKLYKDGLIYQGNRLVNWDPVLKTALSDLEVESITLQGSLWHIRYPLANSDDCLVVATTRPETLLGDTGVAVHPEDERYQHLIGKTVKLPLTDREIPIVADDAVDKEFGTGCVKLTPAHDFNDYEIGKRHNLEMINILHKDATLNDVVSECYQGLTREQARKQVVADLDELGLLEKVDKHEHPVPHGDRSGAILEPRLTKQWYLKMDSLAKAGIDAVKNGDLQFVPENWTKTYMLWLENIQDWCLSRQLWWGHRIPAWYDTDGQVYVGESEADVRREHSLAEDVVLEQDPDVLDTWFSSALWPFATLGWPEKTPKFDQFFPTQTLVTGFDIIFFWVARMVMMSLYFTGKVPFKEVYIHGLIRDNQGKKMSKTKGNVIDPIDIIDGIELEPLLEKRLANVINPKFENRIKQLTKKEFPKGIQPYGTDALRFTFAALATHGRDINFDFARTEGYRNFCNKLWNAGRYILMNTEDYSGPAGQASSLSTSSAHSPTSRGLSAGSSSLGPAHKAWGVGGKLSALPASTSLADRWILTELARATEAAHQAIKAYRFDWYAQALYEFTWNSFCDWYLEASKSQLDGEQRQQTQAILLYVLSAVLRLLHPVIPFITEEMWQSIADQLGDISDSIIRTALPKTAEIPADEQAHADFARIQETITVIRRLRSEIGVSPAKKITLYVKPSSNTARELLVNEERLICSLAKLESIQWADDQEKLDATATTQSELAELFVPLAGLVDKDLELDRLSKQIAKLQKERSKAQGKLANEKYRAQAPADIVAKEEEKLDALSATLDRLSEHYQVIENL
jgi:valyl-tRNA synthetase